MEVQSSVPDRSKIISRLVEDGKFRASYLRAKADVNIPSQIRALRRRRNLTQKALAKEADMLQSRISAMERPGETNFNLETLIRLAAALRTGLIVKFAPFSEVLQWENEFSQDSFDSSPIEQDQEFIGEPEPAAAATEKSDALAAMGAALEAMNRQTDAAAEAIQSYWSNVNLEEFHKSIEAANVRMSEWLESFCKLLGDVPVSHTGVAGNNPFVSEQRKQPAKVLAFNPSGTGSNDKSLELRRISHG